MARRTTHQNDSGASRSSGAVIKVAAASPGASGVYLTSEGVKGDAAWGTRGKWCALTGHTVTIALFDHPKNPGYPTYRHARGYGLFAANPLGRDNFHRTQPAFNYTLKERAGRRVPLPCGNLYTWGQPEELNRETARFAGESE